MDPALLPTPPLAAYVADVLSIAKDVREPRIHAFCWARDRTIFKEDYQAFQSGVDLAADSHPYPDCELEKQLFAESAKAGHPLRLIDVQATREGKKWTHVVRAMSDADLADLIAARKQVAEALDRALRAVFEEHGALRCHWRKPSLSKAVVMRGGGYNTTGRLEIPPALANALTAYLAFHAERGLELRDGGFYLMGKDKPIEDHSVLCYTAAAPVAAPEILPVPSPSQEASWGTPAVEHPVVATWLALREATRVHLPEAYRALRAPASAATIGALESTLGRGLPDAVHALLACNDGQDVNKDGALSGLLVLSCKRIEAEWAMWRKLEDTEDLDGRALTPGVHPSYTRPGWIPLFQDPGRPDYFGVDLDPAEGGRVGQVINFGRNEDDKYVAAASLEAFLDEIRRWLDADPAAWRREVTDNSCVLFNRMRAHALSRRAAAKTKTKPSTVAKPKLTANATAKPKANAATKPKATATPKANVAEQPKATPKAAVKPTPKANATVKPKAKPRSGAAAKPKSRPKKR